MKDTFTMKEFAAIVVRRGKLVLVFAVVFALLLGGWQGFRLIEDANAPKNSPEQIEARYQKALSAYQEEKAAVEKQIVDKEKQLKKQIDYNENSLLMDIDPLNKAVTQIIFMISGLNNEELEQVFLSETTAADYVIGRIQMQYALYWQMGDLEKTLTDTPYGKTEEKYLREVVTMSTGSAGGGYMNLKVTAPTEAISKQVANAVYDMLLRYQPTVVENSYDHRLSVVTQYTKTQIDEDLEATQTANLEKVKKDQTELETLQENLRKLKKPTKEEPVSGGAILIGMVKYTVLGVAIGIVLSVVWIMLSYLFRNCMEVSRHLAQVLDAPMLGSVSKKKGWFDRLADRILGERVWKDEMQALAYLSASALAHLPEKATIALMSTLPICEDAAEIQAVLEALHREGFQVRFAGDAGKNSLAVSAIQESDCVILAESCGISNWNAIQEITMLAESLDTPLKGFLLV